MPHNSWIPAFAGMTIHRIYETGKETATSVMPVLDQVLLVVETEVKSTALLIKPGFLF